jgi:GrpB-like predicted nucleotidyltransferase (UPF0157 family)
MSQIGHSGEWGAEQEEQLRKAWLEEPPKLDGPVLLADYDPGWPGLYEQETARIRSALGDRVLLLEHIGSTSVPGLAAKPLIDILLVVAEPGREETYAPQLERAGYRLVIAEPDWHEHRVLKGRNPDVNLHVHPPESPEVERNLGSGITCGPIRPTASCTSRPSASSQVGIGPTCSSTPTRRPG